jgi:hypothetical protein
MTERSGVLSMATKLSGTGNKNSGQAEAGANLADESAVIGDADGGEFDGEAEVVPPPPILPKDPMIRRKIEDKLERIRLRNELGIYDDDQWKDL